MRVYHYYNILLVLGVTSQLADGKCSKKTDCACTMDDGKVIDISSLKKLSVIDTVKKNAYLFKPCQNFNIGALKGVTLAQNALTTGKWFEVGRDPNVAFQQVLGNNNIQLNIKSNPAAGRAATINLVCSPGTTTPEFTFDGEMPPLSYTFHLKSDACCPGFHPSESEGSSGLSVGSILLIVFFLLLILYFVIGVIYKIKVKHAEGSDRVPNRLFWTALPGLIKDGFRFVISCGGRNAMYSKI